MAPVGRIKGWIKGLTHKGSPSPKSNAELVPQPTGLAVPAHVQTIQPVVSRTTTGSVTTALVAGQKSDTTAVEGSEQQSDPTGSIGVSRGSPANSPGIRGPGS